MKRILLLLLLAGSALWLLPAPLALAAGTPAGTNITNKASVSFVVDSATINQDSNEVTLQVAEVIDVTLQWQDASNLLVKAGDTGKVATFLLTNTGNGSEAFTLAVDNAIAGNQFDPTLAAIYLDANGNGLYDVGVDTQYNPGVNDPELAADASLYIFVVNDIPAGANDTELGHSGLTATANTGTGAPGTAFPEDGDGGIDAVIGASGGAANYEAIYQISVVEVSVVKSQAVADLYGGTVPMPTAVITYSIAVTAAGAGTAESVTITDPIPANTTYIDGSLKLDGVGLTDTADDDAGEATGTPVDQITVRLGDMQDAAKTVTFQVTID